MCRRLTGLVIAVACAAAIAGCGLGPGKGTSDASVTVTRDFGTVPIGSATERTVPGAETVMRMLERFFPVQTRYGGGFVESIDKYAGSSDRRDWFYYVNGVQAGSGAAGAGVHRGDRIWWDLHDWTITQTVPAVVGSFPEPFVHGIGGKRYPTTLECGAGLQPACDRIGTELRRYGVPVADQALGTGSGSDSLNIVVATWSELRGSLAGDLVAHGPQQSWIYARFADGGARLQLLDPRGAVAQTLGAGAGLVAATRDQVSQPEWLVTGTNTAGVLAAASALDASSLHDRFAVAVQGGRRLPIPLQPAR